MAGLIIGVRLLYLNHQLTRRETHLNHFLTPARQIAILVGSNIRRVCAATELVTLETDSLHNLSCRPHPLDQLLTRRCSAPHLLDSTPTDTYFAIAPRGHIYGR